MTSAAAEPKRKLVLTVSRREAEDKLNAQIAEGEELLARLKICQQKSAGGWSMEGGDRVSDIRYQRSDIRKQ